MLGPKYYAKQNANKDFSEGSTIPKHIHFNYSVLLVRRCIKHYKAESKNQNCPGPTELFYYPSNKVEKSCQCAVGAIAGWLFSYSHFYVETAIEDYHNNVRFGSLNNPCSPL